MNIVLKPGGIAVLLSLAVLVGLFLKFRPQSATALPASPEIAVDLSKYYNANGIYSDGSKFDTKGIDGIDAALSGEVLTTSQTWNGASFIIGKPNIPNVVSAQGQEISLPEGRYATLQMLATTAGTGKSPAAILFNIHFTDGSSQTVEKGFSDWGQPQSYPGEAKAVTFAYRNRANGTKDTRSFYVYGYSFFLVKGSESRRTIRSITLPNQPEVKIIAITLK